MKKPANVLLGHNENSIIVSQLQKFFRFKMSVICFTIFLCIFSLAGCKKDISADNEDQSSNVLKGDFPSGAKYEGLEKQTIWELQQAYASSARYRDIKNAFKDGYEDINVIVPNMGHHFMKMSLVDGTFDVRNPEILVYNLEEDGTYTLVAVEYAVPLSASPTAAPEGFTGSADVWDQNSGFGLWLLHAWVWHHNPDGVFNPTNPLVHTH